MKSNKKSLSLLARISLIVCLIIISVIAVCLCVGRSHPQEPPTTEQTEPVQSLPVVIIDAGHGGEDCGAIGKNGVFEKDLNLPPFSIDPDDLFF